MPNMNQRTLSFYYNVSFSWTKSRPCPNNCGLGGEKSCISGLFKFCKITIY